MMLSQPNQRIIDYGYTDDVYTYRFVMFQQPTEPNRTIAIDSRTAPIVICNNYDHDDDDDDDGNIVADPL